uniref:Kazal domain-containing protein n=1 Tax=Culex pipiens pallens TaxID=42434 RepID=I6XC79_CULPA|nr:kazal domain-containing protein [Culex pipiens pallens]
MNGRVLVLFALLGALVVLTEARGRGGADGLCACPRIYLPVCGSDLETYSNDCLLRCEVESNRGRALGLRKLSDGACDNLADNLAELPVEY